MSGFHIYAPMAKEIWMKYPKDKRKLKRKVKTMCCKNRLTLDKVKILMLSYDWYSPSFVYYCKGKCNEKTKRENENT